MILDWSALWKREPGLKPEPIDMSGGVPSLSMYDDWDDEKVIAALCRDAAVALMERHDYYTHFESGMYHLYQCPSNDPIYIDRFSSRDEAYFAACTSILDRCDVAKTKEASARP